MLFLNVVAKSDFDEAERDGEKKGKSGHRGRDGPTPGAAVGTWESGSQWPWVLRGVRTSLRGGYLARPLLLLLTRLNGSFEQIRFLERSWRTMRLILKEAFCS